MSLKTYSDFKNKMADVFYTDKVYTCTITVVTSDRGQKRESASKLASYFYGNVTFPSAKQSLEDYGFKNTVTIAISCDSDTAREVGDIVSFNDEFYKIREILVSKHYKVLGGDKWLSKS